MTIDVGDHIPDFSLPVDGGGTLNATDLVGKRIVLYFYPKDDTSGCTLEAKDFRDAAADFAAANTLIVGVSRDSVASHDKFKAKHDLGFALASDTDGSLCSAFGVWTEKSMYGKKYFGIERSTFLIDGSGKVVSAWRKVKVPGHVAAVLAAAQGMTPSPKP